MSIPLATSYHAGDRSFERDVDYRLASKVVKEGRQTVQKNGNILHEDRDPDNIDHVIKVITTPHPKKIVTVIRDKTRPFAEEQARAKAEKTAQGEKKVKEDTTASRKAAQKARKQARSAAASNKQPKGKK
jgi:deoxyribodipyrimidine photolyase